MDTLFHTVVIAVLLVVAPSLCFADMRIEFVSKERAKQLGMEMRLKGDSANEVWVELEFKAAGELKDFMSVSLEIADGEKTMLGYAPLQPHPSNSGRLLVGFMASRAYLDKLTLRVVTGSLIAEMVGHDLRVRDFLDLRKSR